MNYDNLLRTGRPNPCNGCPDRYPGCSDQCQNKGVETYGLPKNSFYGMVLDEEQVAFVEAIKAMMAEGGGE